LGLDLGGTKIAAAVVEEGRILAQRRASTPQTGAEAVLDAMANVARGLLEQYGPVHAVGVGSPAPVEASTGTILFAPNIRGMENVSVVDRLGERLSLPVVLENDANAAGYAEHLYGAARALESSVFVTLSTGIGGGLFLGDRVVRGANGVAGEIGHMTLLPGGPVGGDGIDGSLEAIAAGRSIARDGSYVYGRSMDTEEVFARARDGEPKALRIVDNAARFTGIGLANLVKVFDPDGFVIGGGMIHVGAFYLDRIAEQLTCYLEGWPVPPLLPAELGTDAGVIGAAAVAAREA
jgi:glucokinase